LAFYDIVLESGGFPLANWTLQAAANGALLVTFDPSVDPVNSTLVAICEGTCIASPPSTASLFGLPFLGVPLYVWLLAGVGVVVAVAITRELAKEEQP
jgi:hypothetical protein